MMRTTTSVDSFVLWLTRLWIHVYTRGLAPEIREARRSELASDIWEQLSQSDSRGFPATGVLLRCLLGIPADLSWRIEHSATAHLPLRFAQRVLAVSEAASRWVIRRGLPGLTVLLAGFYALVGLVVILTIPANQNAPASNLAWFGAFCVIAAALILAGSRRMAAHRKSGIAALVLGALPIALVMATTVVVPVVALLVVVSEIVRVTRPRTRQPASTAVQ